MSYDYSENILVQGAAGDLLHDELGWDLVYAHNQETLGPNGMLGRTDYREVLLTKYLRPALFRLNSWMTEAYADSVVVPSSIMRKFIYKSGRTQSAQGRETCH